MSSPAKALCNIVIVGDGLRAALCASYLSVRCGQSGTRIHIVPSGEARADIGDVFARPNIRHLHQLLKIPEKQIVGPAQARRAYAVDINIDKRKVTTPFGAYGNPYKGVAFVHLHRRLAQIQSLPPLDYYNLNLRLQALGPRPPFFPKAEFGYIFPRESYTRLLRHYAKAYGASFLSSSFVKAVREAGTGFIQTVKTAEEIIATDCVIDVTPSAKVGGTQQAGWNGNCLYISIDNDWPGIELFRLQAAMERMSNFMPDQSFNAFETGEYNRLTTLEGERIEDMRAFGAQGVEAGKMRPELQRKIDVFSNRGRIPSEDYEVFSPPEWRAAFMSKGLIPKHYDRLADVLSETELKDYINILDKSIVKKLSDAQAKGQ